MTKERNAPAIPVAESANGPEDNPGASKRDRIGNDDGEQKAGASIKSKYGFIPVTRHEGRQNHDEACSMYTTSKHDKEVVLLMAAYLGDEDNPNGVPNEHVKDRIMNVMERLEGGCKNQRWTAFETRLQKLRQPYWYTLKQWVKEDELKNEKGEEDQESSSEIEASTKQVPERKRRVGKYAGFFRSKVSGS